MRQIFVIILAVCLTATTTFAADYVLIIGGVAGEKSFYDAFWGATSRFHQLLTDEYGYAPDQITFLFEDMGDIDRGGQGELELVDAESNREQVFAAFDQLTGTVQPSDRFLLFMIGHASRTGRGSAKFNLRGRDITEAEYVTLINGVPAENQILIFGFPYSGRLVPQLSAPGRIILTSSSPNEGYSLQAGFGDVFVSAFSAGDNDINSDGDISVLEAFLSLQTQTKAWYESDGTIQSEHPHLDDNGDGNATRNLTIAPEISGVDGTDDGALAEKTFLGTRRSTLPSTPPPSEREVTVDILPSQPPEALEHGNPDTLAASNNAENRKPALPYNYISEADEKVIQHVIETAPAQADYPEDGAVVLWETVDVDIDEKSRYIYSTRRIVKIFNEDGVDLAEISIPYMRGKDDVTIHHARTITPDGRLVELDLNEVISNVPPPSAVDAGLYVDARLMYFTLPEITDGCIIDYAYSTNNLGHVMQGEFWRKVYFQGSQPVQYYRFTVHIPKKKQLHYQVSGAPVVGSTSEFLNMKNEPTPSHSVDLTRNLQGQRTQQASNNQLKTFLDIKPTITENNYIRTYTFEARDVPPLKEEYLMPAPQDLAYSISISSIDSWDKLVTWYATLIREQDTITPEITKKTEQLLRGAWSRKEKVKRLYEYVATNIQYLGYELGIWAIKPYPADFVLKVGKGDCKDKTTLLSTMLSSAGINSYPVLISAGDTRGVNAHLPDGGSEVEAVPSLAYFNHMILAVEGNKDDEFIWLDPTAETCAFGDFPASDQDRWALIINPRFLTEDKAAVMENSDDVASAESMENKLYLFQKSPALDATSNLKRVHTHVAVKEDMSVSVRQELTVTGVFNMKLRSQLSHLQTSEEKAEFFHKLMELDERAKVTDVEVAGLSELKGELKVELTWTCQEYLYAIGSQFVLELPIVKHPYAELLSEERRMYPAVIGKALSLEDKISVRTEAPFRVDTVPEAQTLKTGVAEIQIRYDQSKRKAEMHQVIHFLTPSVTPDNIYHLIDVVRIASNRGPKRFILTQD